MSVTETVAEGLAGDLQRIGTLLRSEEGRGLVVDAQVKFHFLARMQVGDDGVERPREAELAQVFRSQPGDVFAYAPNDIVEAVPAFFQARVRLGWIGSGPERPRPIPS